SFDNLDPDAYGVLPGNRTCCEAPPQSLALQKFCNGVRDITVVANVKNGNDVGMRKCSQRFGLALKTRSILRIVGDAARKDLDCELSIEPVVTGTIHLTHPSRAKLIDDNVWSEGCPRRQ